MLFTDEATFTCDGINNSCNTHRWSQENPNAIVETNFQQRFSVNVWCGIIDDQAIGPFILEYRLTGQSYLAFLQNKLPELQEDVPLATKTGLYFKHDGAPPHFSHAVIQYPNNTFPGRWMNGSWSASLATEVSRPQPHGLWFVGVDEKPGLRETNCSLAFLDAAARIKKRHDQLRRTTRDLRKRVAKCIEVESGIFENLL
jgi:hypothetical protein